MRSFHAPPRASFWQKLGPGGLASLALAFASGIATLGLPVWFQLRRVIRASTAPDPAPADAILVLGRRLERDQPTEVFRERLAHAAALWRRGLSPAVLVAGGVTGTATRSEAEAGRGCLLALGLPDEAILLEDRSQHTLENLFNIREELKTRGWSRLILVSDPLHQARALAFAEGLGLDAVSSPAPDCPPRRGSLAWWNRAAREAFLLHWYRTGMLYSRLIGSRKQLSRVT